MQQNQNTPYSTAEEKLNAITHGIGFAAAIWGLVILIWRAQGTLAVSSVAVYGVSLVLMFLASTLYHIASNQSVKAVLKLVDHSAIYLLIAGTYTPFMLIALNGWVGITGVAVIWTVAIAGLILKWRAPGRFKKLSLILYLAMGWLVFLFMYPLYQAVPSAGLWLLGAGGVCFSIGVAFYVAKHKQFTHAIWHCFVVAGCSCHFMSIYHYVI